MVSIGFLSFPCEINRNEVHPKALVVISTGFNHTLPLICVIQGEVPQF
jgi:hypothetical protein